MFAWLLHKSFCRNRKRNSVFDWQMHFARFLGKVTINTQRFLKKVKMDLYDVIGIICALTALSKVLSF